MIFLIRYIYRLIVTNPVKLILLAVGFGSLYVNLNYIEPNYTYTKNVLSEFEVHGQKYIVIEDDGKTDNFRSEKLTSELNLSDDGTKISQEGIVGWYLGLWVSFGLCMGIVLLCPIESECRWNFRETYNECRIRNVKVDREGSKLYYHYRGRILKVFDTGDDEMYNGKGLNIGEVSSLLNEFIKTPNLYEKYVGTKSKIRQNKIDKLFPNGQEEK